MSANAVLTLLAAPVWTLWAAHRLTFFYNERGSVKENYRGKQISPSLGPALLLGYLFIAAASVWFAGAAQIWLLTAPVFLGVSLFGLWDDLMAEDHTSGFKGHFGAGVQGTMTSGLLKVVTAVLVVLIFTGSLTLPLLHRLLALLVILLSANGLNLLDRRPGRSLKVFFLTGLLLLAFAQPLDEALVLLVPLLAIALAVAPFDLRADGMLGDCGANLLGAVLGVTAVLFLTPAAQLALLLFWAAVHILAEYVSISRLVESSRLLQYLDSLGRSQEKMP